MGKWERWQKNKPCDLNPQALHKYKANVQQSVDILLEHVTLCVYVFKALVVMGALQRTQQKHIRTHLDHATSTSPLAPHTPPAHL